MQTIIIELENDEDKHLILMLLKRLGLRWVIKPVLKTPDNDELKNSLKIIEAGVDAEEGRLQEILSWHEEDRKGRDLPSRSS